MKRVFEIKVTWAPPGYRNRNPARSIEKMRFSLGSLLLFVTGAALVTFAGTLGSHLLVTTFALFLIIVGALVGRRRFWASALLAAIGGALGVWLGLLFHAFALSWNNLSDVPNDSLGQETYRQFVRDTFVLQSAFVVVQGLVVGFLVATLLWGLMNIISRFRRIPS
jgi:hypothetical protein